MLKKICVHLQKINVLPIDSFMYFWLINVIAAVILCIICSGIIIPQILLISFRKNLFDVPDARKIHTLAVPRLGGLSFMPVVFFSCVLMLGIDLCFGQNELISVLIPEAKTLAFLACAVLMLYVIGMADDLIGIKYRAKFVVQMICAVFMIAGGVWISSYQGILGFWDISPWFGYPFTVVVMIYILNAVNLIDGIDGLCSGLCSVALLVYGVVYFIAGQYVYSILACCTFAVLVPFFYFNVFGDATKRKKIFMGDTGSLTLGMMISFLAIHIEQLPSMPELNNANMCAIAFVPLLIPCFDVLRVYGERIFFHQNPFLPDKRHIHHKLLELGLPQRVVMVVIVATSLLFTFVNIVLSMYVEITVLLFSDMAIWLIAMIGLNKLIAKRKLRDLN